MSLSNMVKRSPALRAALAGPIALRRQYLKFLDRRSELILDRLATTVQGDVILSVPEFDGSFALSPSSDLFRSLLVEGRYEPILANLFAKHVSPNRDILDVGANVGFFTVLGAKRLLRGRVLAIEPTEGAGARLKRNLIHNSVSEKVILFEGLVSSGEGFQLLNVVKGREEYSSIGALAHPSIAGEEFVQELVPTMTLDSLVSAHQLDPGLIKIDVEGAEALVFAGATNTLATHRPVIISELSDYLLRKMGASAAKIVSDLERLGYRVTDPIDPKAGPGTRDFGDILAVPLERLQL
jgi:FkbM family methyltransferase